MGRYTPPVPSSRYQIAFVPVLDGVRKGGRKWTEDSGLGSSGREVAVFCCEERERVRAHLLRTARHCWCDKHTKQLIMKVGGQLGTALVGFWFSNYNPSCTGSTYCAVLLTLIL